MGGVICWCWHTNKLSKHIIFSGTYYYLRLKVFLLAKKPKVFSFEHLKVVDRDFMPAIRTYKKLQCAKGACKTTSTTQKQAKNLTVKLRLDSMKIPFHTYLLEFSQVLFTLCRIF